MASDWFAAVHVFYASHRALTKRECHKVLYRWGTQRSPIQAALLSAETGEVEAGAEGIHEITLVMASLWDATQERLRVTQEI